MTPTFDDPLCPTCGVLRHLCPCSRPPRPHTADAFGAELEDAIFHSVKWLLDAGPWHRPDARHVAEAALDVLRARLDLAEGERNELARAAISYVPEDSDAGVLCRTILARLAEDLDYHVAQPASEAKEKEEPDSQEASA